MPSILGFPLEEVSIYAISEGSTPVSVITNFNISLIDATSAWKTKFTTARKSGETRSTTITFMKEIIDPMYDMYAYVYIDIIYNNNTNR